MPTTLIRPIQVTDGYTTAAAVGTAEETGEYTVILSEEGEITVTLYRIDGVGLNSVSPRYELLLAGKYLGEFDCVESALCEVIRRLA